MSLIKTLKENENARKLFGKKEIEIVEKQLNGIKLTPSEQTRLSRDIRKKFQAIKELSEYTGEFQIQKGELLKEKINNAKNIILESKYLSRIKKIVLFGSAVENDLNYRSDIDIAVIFSEISKQEAEEFRIKTMGRLSDKIDIQVYNILPDKIKKQIDEKGRIIYKI